MRYQTALLKSLIALFLGLFLLSPANSQIEDQRVSPNGEQCPENTIQETEESWLCTVSGITGEGQDIDAACTDIGTDSAFIYAYTSSNQCYLTTQSRQPRVVGSGYCSGGPVLSCYCMEGYATTDGTTCHPVDQAPDTCPEGQGMVLGTCTDYEPIDDTPDPDPNDPCNDPNYFGQECGDNNQSDDNGGIDFGGDSGSGDAGSGTDNGDTSTGDNSSNDSGTGDAGGSSPSNVFVIGDDTSDSLRPSSDLNPPCDSRYEDCRPQPTASTDPSGSDPSYGPDPVACVRYGSAACCTDTSYYYRAAGESCSTAPTDNTGDSTVDIDLTETNSLLTSVNQHLANITDKLCDPRVEQCEGEHGITSQLAEAASAQVSDAFDATQSENADLLSNELQNVTDSNPVESIVSESDFLDPWSEITDLGDSSCSPVVFDFIQTQVVVDCQQFELFRTAFNYLILMYTALYLIDMLFDGFTPRDRQGRLF